MSDCPQCEYHKNRAARWRAEAYRQAGHDVIELPWVGLTDEEREQIRQRWATQNWMLYDIINAVDAKLREKNNG